MSTIKCSTITDLSGGTSVNVPNAAKAWVNFNGTGTVAIRASYNVSSITDNNTGDYTVNFTVAMSDVNYSAQGSGVRFTQVQSGTHSTTQLQVLTQNLAGSQSDDSGIDVTVFR
jgi:hypothetical protein